MLEPVVSIIMCVRDGQDYLREALDSIYNQHLSNPQVVVIDDGSKDFSAKIARDHPLAPQVFSQEPQGVGAAINRGLLMAQGNYLSFLDADDVWPLGRMNSMLSRLMKDDDVDLVHGLVVNTDKSLNAVSEPLPAKLIGSLVVRRSSALRIGPFRTDVKHAAILDWIGRSINVGLKSEMVDEVVLLRRIHGNNMGIQDRPDARKDLLAVVRGHLVRTRGK